MAGQPGSAGRNGTDGIPGSDGIQVSLQLLWKEMCIVLYNFHKGRNGSDGMPGSNGLMGKPGPPVSTICITKLVN